MLKVWYVGSIKNQINNCKSTELERINPTAPF